MAGPNSKVGGWWLGMDPLRHIIVPVSASLPDARMWHRCFDMGYLDRELRSQQLITVITQQVFRHDRHVFDDAD